MNRRIEKTGAVILLLFPVMIFTLPGQTPPLRSHLMAAGGDDIESPGVTETDSTVLALSSVFRDMSPWVANPFDDMVPFSVFALDTVTAPRGLFKAEFDKEERRAEIAQDWTVITFYEAVEGDVVKVPFSAPLDWYISQRIYRNRIKSFYALKGQLTKKKQRAQTSALELLGMETGAGRVSVNIRGNVNVLGKMVFQDQELARANFLESQTTHFEFDQRQNLHTEGKIGDRVTVLMDYDSERDFNWENNIRIHYTGDEDEIIQKIEAGNIALSLPSTQFVTFSGRNEGLFGLKSVMKLGPVDITSVASIEQTNKEKLKFKAGAETRGQSILDYQYRKNQYFFIDRVFRDGGQLLDNDGNPVVGETGAILGALSFYPLDERGRHALGNVVVKEIEVFRSVGGESESGT
ncbi:MAG: hypothetical protein ACE5GH_03705, partial [Fidelibacterota bacterium]